MIGQEERLRGLVDVGILLTSELSLETVLERLLGAAAELTGARYAALGVIDPSGKSLERFIHRGIDEDTAREVGDLPVGRGILGALIRDARPLRLRELGEDPRSVGFPPGHPPMRSFLGVPILLRGAAYGNLYLTEKQDGEFTAADEEVASILAAQAAVAIENARLYSSATHWMNELRSMDEIGQALVSDLDVRHVLELICERLLELVGARVVFVALPGPDDSLRLEAATAEHDVTTAVGVLLPMQGSLSGRAFVRKRTVRVDSFLEDPEIDREFARKLAELMGIPIPTAGIFVPLIVRDRAIGVLAAHDRIRGGNDLRFTEQNVRLVEALAARAAVAVDLSRRVERESLQRVVAAQEMERRRIARELHDETGQALTSLLLGLRAAQDAKDEAARNEALESLRALASATLQDVRRLAVDLRPKALDDFGLVAALERLVEGLRERTGMTIEFEASLDVRLPAEVETAVYRIVQEALTNIVKHARATTVSVLVAQRKTGVTAVIEDNGAGFSPGEPGEGFGLLSMRERASLVGGHLIIESRPGGGTTIAAEVPVE
jgi:signal transduction histidine kinase